MEADDRFKHISTDPKFRHIRKEDKKVKIDKRFHGMFKDEKFKIKYTVDKRGRPVNHVSSNDLKRYYNMSSESDDSDEEIDESAGKFVRAPKVDPDSDLKLLHKNEKSVSKDVKKKLKNLSVDYARGEDFLNSDSSSDDEESEEASEESDIEHGWGELDRDAETTEEITNRLAVCNMDWDRIRAVDLMVLFNSFLPAGGHIKSVSIYPSEFGLKRMKEEDVKGPTELIQCDNTKQKLNDNETEEGSKYHMEKLRQYQLNRLRYYYAVMVLDSPETANKIYTECDGLEYESSATKVDLRFIPNNTTFDHAPKEVCDSLPEVSKYEPRFFTTTALQQAKVNLTWDETNPSRLEIAKKLTDGKVEDVSEADLQAYLASSSSEEESEDEAYSSTNQNEEEKLNPIEKYRALLSDLEKTDDKRKDVEMEVTWELNSKNDTEKMVQKKLAEDSNKTPFQQYLQKRKEKRKMKRQERKKPAENSDDSDDVDMNDPYFAEEFDKSEFKKKKDKSEKNSEDTTHEKAQLELLLLDDENEKKHFNFKKKDESESGDIERKKKKKKYKIKKEETKSSESTDDFKVNVNDARFSAIFTSHHYNIDPTDPSYRSTEAMKNLIEEKQKRITCNNEETSQSPPSKKAKLAELNALVSSVKRKTKNIIKKN